MSKKNYSRIKSKANLQYLKKKIKIQKDRQLRREKRKLLIKRTACHSLWITLSTYAIYRLFV